MWPVQYLDVQILNVDDASSSAPSRSAPDVPTRSAVPLEHGALGVNRRYRDLSTPASVIVRSDGASSAGYTAAHQG